jgi:hypothetical protein
VAVSTNLQEQNAQTHARHSCESEQEFTTFLSHTLAKKQPPGHDHTRTPNLRDADLFAFSG